MCATGGCRSGRRCSSLCGHAPTPTRCWAATSLRGAGQVRCGALGNSGGAGWRSLCDVRTLMRSTAHCHTTHRATPRTAPRHAPRRATHRTAPRHSGIPPKDTLFVADVEAARQLMANEWQLGIGGDWPPTFSESVAGACMNDAAGACTHAARACQYACTHAMRAGRDRGRAPCVAWLLPPSFSSHTHLPTHPPPPPPHTHTHAPTRLSAHHQWASWATPPCP
jgi:hypothetical protein